MTPTRESVLELVERLNEYPPIGRSISGQDKLGHEAGSTLTALVDALEESRKDAERYRWIRQHGSDGELPERLDRSVDAAIGAAPKGPDPIEAARFLCEIYFNIASEVIGEAEVNKRRDAAIDAAIKAGGT